jgi:Leucine-rich repeat (LRR) protein
VSSDNVIAFIEQKYGVHWNDKDALKALTILNLSHTPLGDLSPLGELIHLNELYLDDTLSSDISILSHLTQLHTLSLEDNSILDLSPLSRLKKLTLLDLEGNAITHIPKELLALSMEIRLYDEDKGGIIVEDNPIQSPPLEIIAQGKEALRHYFSEMI